ncbi:hypothetical protein R3I93_019915 [Phoxinus phoxinus]|uniref:Uncharacterized protein n=1 Tax=Phoxinus phoxinus TaxID=58324 RepID=A0AAN9CEU0_9TELE
MPLHCKKYFLMWTTAGDDLPETRQDPRGFLPH